MAFTRFHDDPSRIKKRLEEGTFAGRYALDTPGPGSRLPYMEDPQIRLQRWGANLMTNTVNLESDLLGLSRKLNRDLTRYNDYKWNSISSEPVRYDSAPVFIDESRATHPAWMFRDIQNDRWEEPMLNPQANIEKQFEHNVDTRLYEKDNYKPQMHVFPTNDMNQPNYKPHM